MQIVPEIRGVKDPYAQPSAQAWKTTDAGTLSSSTLEADVIIIGSGAGGGTSAEIFTQAGLKVIIIEEGPLKSTNDFKMDERDAYKELYQEQAGRMTKDGGMSILQGRCVGGTTVVNWTSSFRTPEQTLNYWKDEFQVEGCNKEEMAPWFSQMEQRLNIAPWLMPQNTNNATLSEGCDKLGIPWKVIPRNVAGCWNLGYCGMGCPTNAKQSMLVTTIPSALKQGAQLLYSARADRLTIEGTKVTGVVCSALDKDYQPTGSTITVKAPHIVMACGGINGPALLLRSKAPDPQNRIGKRTFLHPVAFSFAQFEKNIDPFYGAPQSIYSDHFQWQTGARGPMGYKLEVPPLHPGLASVLLMGHGEKHVEDMSKLSNTSAMIGLLRDGFDDESTGGSVELSDDGSPIIDYPLNDYVWDGVKRSHLTMAEIQFASGASRVRPAHQDGRWFDSFEAFKVGVEELEYQTNTSLVGCAHVMGGLTMGEDKEICMVDSECKYHYLDNLYVFDGSVFPTSIGANPQLSIYGMACKQATTLAKKLKPEAFAPTTVEPSDIINATQV
jgi:choline dehydrogenase-like flavoprotein